MFVVDINNYIKTHFEDFKSYDYVLSDSGDMSNVLASGNDKTDLKLKFDLDSNKLYYLMLKIKTDRETVNRGPFVINKKMNSLSYDNGLINTPVVSLYPEKDEDGNVIAYHIQGSEFNSNLPNEEHYATTYIVKSNDEVVFKSVHNTTNLTTIALPDDVIKNNLSYTIIMTYISTSGLTSNPSVINVSIEDNLPVDVFEISSTVDIDSIIKRFVKIDDLYTSVIKSNTVASLVKTILANFDQRLSDAIDLCNTTTDIEEIKTKLLEYKTDIDSVVNSEVISDMSSTDIDTFISKVKQMFIDYSG